MKRNRKDEKNHLGHWSCSKKHWSMKVSAWITVFLVSFLLTACGSVTQDTADGTGIGNRVINSSETGGAGTGTVHGGNDAYTDASADHGKDTDLPVNGGSNAGTDDFINQETTTAENKENSDNTGIGNDTSGNSSDTKSEGALSSEQEGAPKDDPTENDLAEDGTYTSKEDVAYYLFLYGHLPSNFITKKDAEKLGWKGGSLEPYAPGMCIGGSRFGNYEGLLPAKEGRFYTECDIDTLGADKRGAKRIVFSNDGLIYYTEDHYQTFELLYGEE